MKLEKLFEIEARQDFDDVNAIRSSNIPSFLDEWVVTGLLGRGSFGNVYEIVKPQDGISPQRCALKICQVVNPEDAEIRRQEIETQRLLTGSANAVQIEDFALISREPPRVSYLLIRMELLSPLPEEGLSEREVIKMGIDICSVLEKCAAMEPKLIHCDIKPANILLSPDGRYKLADFGTAKTLQATMTYTGNRGTPLYMAPEVAAYTGYDSRCDIFSLGYTMLTMLNGGRHPYQDAGERTDILREMYTSRKLPPIKGVSSGLMKIIKKMCEPSLTARYSRAGTVRRDLELFVRRKAEAEKQALYDTERRIEQAKRKATGQRAKNLELAENHLKSAKRELSAAENSSGTPRSRLAELESSVRQAALAQSYVVDGCTFEEACRKAAEKQKKDEEKSASGGGRIWLPICVLFLGILLGATFAGIFFAPRPPAVEGSGKTEQYRDFVFELTSDGNGYILIDYTGEDVCAPRIPTEFNWKPVLHIGDKAFYDADNIRKVTITDNVQSIGESAFEGCDWLQDVVMGKNVEYVAGSAFLNCPQLNDKPKAETDIPKPSANNTTVPSETPSFKDVDLTHQNFELELTEDGRGCVIKKYTGNSHTIIVPPEVNSVPVLEIGDEAFADAKSIESIIIGNRVETIGKSAFRGDYYYTAKIIIGENVTYIDDSAFGFPAAPDIVQFMSMKYFKDYDFELTADGQGWILKKYHGSGFSNILIPEEIEGLPVLHIADRAFYDNDEIITVSIGDNVKTIGESAFEGCDRLESVDLGINVTDIHDSSFLSCPKQKFFHYEDFIFQPAKSGNGYALVKYDGSGSEAVVIPDTVNGKPVLEISDYAFYYADGISEVTIGNYVTYIGWSAFEHCLDLKNVVMGSRVTTIEAAAFYNCPQLGYVALPKSLLYFSSGAFNIDPLLRDSSEARVVGVGEEEFYNGFTFMLIDNGTAYAVENYNDDINSPATVRIPDSYNGKPITEIYHHAFCNVDYIYEVTIGSNVRTIGTGAFEHCDHLRTVKNSDSVTEIGEGAFRNCPNLKDIPTVN